MKNVLKTITIFCLNLVILFAGMQFNEVLFVPWGEGENQLKHESYPGLHNGPLSFQVENNDIFILDTENKKLKTYTGKKLSASRSIEEPFVIDFHVDGSKLYLMKQNDVYCLENGVKTRIAHLGDNKAMYNGFRQEGLNSRISGPKGSIALSQNYLAKSNIKAINVRRELPNNLILEIAGNEHRYIIDEVASVDLIGTSAQGDYYVYAESILEHSPLRVQRYVLLIDADGNLEHTLALPMQKYTYVFKEFFIGATGELYHMHSAKDGIHIIRWDLDSQKDTYTSYPDAFSEEYHFNDFLVSEPEIEEENSLTKPTARSINRAGALEIADEYVTHVWTATAANIGTTSIVTTPEWIKVGQNQRVPYKWGGWNTVAEFDAGVAAGKLAGDRNTSAGVDWSGCVGADCSGFVCVCWETTSRYTTSSFHQVTTELASFNDLLPADATNNAGSHIRLVVEWTAQGKLVQIEETASGNPGWAARYYTWNISDLGSYKPVRYNSIENSIAPRPTLTVLTSNVDSVYLEWEADETVEFDGYKILRKTKNESEFSVIATVPKGTLNTTLTQTPTVHYDYAIGAYVSTDLNYYNISDVYSAMDLMNDYKVLIVDGFDRMGSYAQPTHKFVSQIATALDHWSVTYNACANEAVIYSDIDLEDYDLVWWICGDESTSDQTFNSTEQSMVKAYLQQGGKLFVSGSEIGWDLDNKGNTSDKEFIYDFLKAKFSEDDADNYHVKGTSGTHFEPLDFYYSEDGSQEGTYPEDYPDVLSTNGGSQSVLKYANGKNAAVAFSGMFTGGSEEGQVITMGFPFEVITTAAKREALAGEILKYMGHDTGVSIEETLPTRHQLMKNYPNPFNPTTTIEYSLEAAANTKLTVFNMKGEMLKVYDFGYMNAGTHKLTFDGTNIPSGVYVYRLEVDQVSAGIGKMVLSK